MDDINSIRSLGDCRDWLSCARICIYLHTIYSFYSFYTSLAYTIEVIVAKIVTFIFRAQKLPIFLSMSYYSIMHRYLTIHCIYFILLLSILIFTWS